MSKPREWLIKGGMCPNGFDRIFVDGKVPEINESVQVIEYSAYKKAIEALKDVECTCAWAPCGGCHNGQLVKRVLKELGATIDE